MKALHMVTFTLLVIGGLNWGLEVFNVGIGNYIPSGVAATVYALVGLSAIYEIAAHKANCRMCGSQSAGATL